MSAEGQRERGVRSVVVVGGGGGNGGDGGRELELENPNTHSRIVALGPFGPI